MAGSAMIYLITYSNYDDYRVLGIYYDKRYARAALRRRGYKPYFNKRHGMKKPNYGHWVKKGERDGLEVEERAWGWQDD